LPYPFGGVDVGEDNSHAQAMNDEMPPANLILQALHAIRAEGQKTNERLDSLIGRVGSLESSTNQRLDALNERVDNLRVFTVQGLTDLNTKVDRLAGVVERQGEQLHTWAISYTSSTDASTTSSWARARGRSSASMPWRPRCTALLRRLTTEG
jgi:hypothetical protein